MGEEIETKRKRKETEPERKEKYSFMAHVQIYSVLKLIMNNYRDYKRRSRKPFDKRKRRIILLKT